MAIRQVFIDDPEDIVARNNAIATAEAQDERMLHDEFVDGKRRLTFVDADDDPDDRTSKPKTTDDLEFRRLQEELKAQRALTLSEISEYLRLRDNLV